VLTLHKDIYGHFGVHETVIIRSSTTLSPAFKLKTIFTNFTQPFLCQPHHFISVSNHPTKISGYILQTDKTDR